MDTRIYKMLGIWNYGHPIGINGQENLSGIQTIATNPNRHNDLVELNSIAIYSQSPRGKPDNRQRYQLMPYQAQYIVAAQNLFRLIDHKLIIVNKKPNKT